jgi:hypothetical protein
VGQYSDFEPFEVLIAKREFWWVMGGDLIDEMELIEVDPLNRLHVVLVKNGLGLGRHGIPGVVILVILLI